MENTANMDRKKYRNRVMVVIGMLLFVSFSFYIYQILFTPNFQYKKADKFLYIRKGADFKEVLDSLTKNQMIGDIKSFAFLSKLVGYQSKVKPGKYLIKSDRNNIQVIRLLKSGRQTPVQLTFNNIRLKEDLAEKLSAKLSLSYDTLLYALKSETIAKHYGFDTTTFMSMFIPNTYEVYWSIDLYPFLDKMKNEYNKFWTQERLAKAQEIGLTPLQVSVMASIVEAETNQPTERPRVAGLYLNRYHINMLLQADPTVKFALRDFSLKRIYQVHTKFDSPYNTYLYKGLPPGPINLPSIESIDAVLNYERHHYLYFCASPIRIGFHDFTETYQEHVNNANKYRTFLDHQQIQ
jgi:UPF0755 protein